ncbi:MAG: hypothetical protein QNJ40_09480 [Xanthomonadales bacterium]|nr:hypothetical protein [Xanthomonadales bacterium]
MNRLLQWGITLALAGLAVLLFYSLSLNALSSWLQQEARHTSQQNAQGFRWEFEQTEDLVGSQPVGFDDSRIHGGTLKVPAASGSGYLSLNLNGDRIDATLFSRWWMRIRLDSRTPTQAIIYFREDHGGTIYQSEPLPVRPGWQVLKTDLSAVRWTSDPKTDGQAVWGGLSGTVASIRVHPVAQGVAGMELDWIRLEPSGPPLPERPELRIRSASKLTADLPRNALVTLDIPWPTTARVLAAVDQLEAARPAAALVLDQSVARAPASSWSWTILVAASVMLLLAVSLNGPVQAGLKLVGVTGLVSLLLTHLGAPLPWGLAGVLLAAALIWLVLESVLEDRPELVGSRPAWNLALSITIVLAVPAVFMDGPPEELPLRWVGYLVWAGFQQLVLCLVLLRLCLQLTGSWRVLGAGLAAILFGLAHYPNFELMLGTLLLGGLLVAHFLKFRALLPLAFSHATLGAIYLTMAPSWVIHSGAVGSRLFH